MKRVHLLKAFLLGGSAAGVFALLASVSLGQETGETLFKSKCAMCHGPDGAGKTMMGEKLKIPDLHSDIVQKKPDAELKQVITKGKNGMPSYDGKLSADQITKVVSFIRDLAKKQ